jgi:hypothetical protein
VASAVTGTGTELAIPFSSDSLNLGENQLKIQAWQRCANAPVEATIVVHKYYPEILSVNSTNLPDGSVKLTATSNLSTATIQWYENESGGEAIYTGSEFIPPVSKESKKYFAAAISTVGACSSERAAILAIGTEDNPELSSVKVYPNPVQSDLHIETLKGDVQKIEMTNMLGQVIATIHVNQEQKLYTVDVKAWSKGIYLMVVTKKSSKLSYRLSKE